MEKHQICLIGGQVLTAYYGIKHEGPDVLHFVYTSDSKSQMEILMDVIGKKNDMRAVECSPFDFEDIERKLEGILLDNPEAHFSINLTGGTKPMALGAYQLRDNHAVDLFYFTSDKKRINLITKESVPHQITADNGELVELSGNKVQSKQHFPEEIESETLKAAKKAGHFVENNTLTYNMICRKLNEIGFYKSKMKVPKLLNVSRTITLTHNEHRLLVETEQGAKLLDITHKEVSDILFRGNWWEIMVADAVHRWNPNREIWLNTIFPLKSNELISKNEIDVLVNFDTVMLFLECKTGVVGQDDVNKIAAVQKVYGGGMSKSALISYDVLSQNVKEKCKDARIKYLYPENGKKSLDLLKKIPDFLDEIYNSRML